MKNDASYFFSEKKALREEENQKESELEAAYQEANLDPDRIEFLQDWEAFENIDIELDEDLEWLKNTGNQPDLQSQ